MMKVISNFWSGKKSLLSTNVFTTLPLIVYLYVLNKVNLGIEMLSFFIFADILGVIISFFTLACVWRSSENSNNKLGIVISKLLSSSLVVIAIYYGYIKWII